MTCKFFTIIKSYFQCCCDKHPKDGDSSCSTRYTQDCVEENPITFDDLTYTNESGSSSAWSSSSTLDGYDEKRKKDIKETFHRIKKYKRKLFHPYEEYYSD
jgi:hypothetical protein